eukprot:CAMPEP_0201128966 /NCGR_PEP_ID=MMETSP0850-20130426/35330_1 /ASSEMBLY_ACC=CAM_ASM_000622 /TAXON_ID=183588 /ORGANISM="Pseudo-nitzschia fraudulenta, Strain WWA7" /LENGTH=801 /DNA_ID=CAMNT_0047398307 /DNA_START=110 /DNA_END=2515 /DNA_ORIENTATION=-
MPNPTSSAVVFSGYFPIEVTNSEYLETVEKDLPSNSQRSKKHSSIPNRSMSRRIGGLLSSSRHKKKSAAEKNNRESDRHSVSESHNGQQSVASKKTIDSGTTIKASNLHQEQQEAQTKLFQISSNLMNAEAVEGNKSVGSPNRNTAANKRNNGPPNPWRNLRRLVGGRHNSKQQQQTPSETPESSPGIHASNRPISYRTRSHAKSHDGAEAFSTKIPLNNSYPMRKRFYSEGVDAVPKHQQQQQTKSLGSMSFSGFFPYTSERQHAMDQVIRGRLDGIDVLSLGTACLYSLSVASCDDNNSGNDKNTTGDGKNQNSFDPLHRSFTDPQQQPVSPARLVDEMVWMSGGMDQPEIILEGFYPGGCDRWSVRIAALPSSLADQTIREDTASNENTEDNTEGDERTEVSSSHTNVTDYCEDLPVSELWDSLWGYVATPPPIPSHMNIQTGNKNEDPLFSNEGSEQSSPICNVPIDLDDDAFIIDSPQHVTSVHEAVMVPLQSRRFESAISLFEKLQRGLDGKKYNHLMASTSHNIGMVRLCQGNYQEALESFGAAVELRKECLPSNHTDIAVSLQRQGMANFALDSTNEALKCFEAALGICTAADNTRAKILNNIGVARYHLGDYSQGLKSFNAALEIQRPWLEGPIKRESVVYSASTTLSNVGKVYLRKGDHDLAYVFFEEAFWMQTATFRKDHDMVLCSLDNMARAHAKQGNYTEALRKFTSLYRSQEARFGPNSKSCIETVGMMGVAQFKLLEYEEAEICLARVLTWQADRGMEKTHPSVQITAELFGQIKRCIQGKDQIWV